MSGETMSGEELRALCAFLYERTGMSYGEAKRYFLERRIRQGMLRTNSATPSAYLRLVRSEAREASRLINSVTVNESYFWRETEQLACLADHLLPAVTRTRKPGALVRIWCVPCASGEEPYSIAIWLLESYAMVDAWNIEIVGSDIDTETLCAAAEGRYGARALSRLPDPLRSRYFAAQPGGIWRILQDLRESVRFVPVNLADPGSMARQGVFDVIFCRNALIYFDDASRRQAAEGIWQALAPGGYACLGHAEAMTRIDGRFVARRFGDAMVYQKPGGGADG